MMMGGGGGPSCTMTMMMWPGVCRGEATLKKQARDNVLVLTNTKCEAQLARQKEERVGKVVDDADEDPLLLMWGTQGWVHLSLCCFFFLVSSSDGPLCSL